MSTITSRQRAFLRSQAHALKPVVLVGAEGLTPAVLASVLEAFNTRELLKVKVLEGAPEDARTTAGQLVEAVPGAQVPQVIGRTVVLYRPFPKDPVLVLPG
jgi:RNA-binding protein